MVEEGGGGQSLGTRGRPLWALRGTRAPSRGWGTTADRFAVHANGLHLLHKQKLEQLWLIYFCTIL